MNKWLYKRWVKIIVWILFIIFSLGTVSSVVGILVVSETGGYSTSAEKYKKDKISEEIREYGSQICNVYMQHIAEINADQVNVFYGDYSYIDESKNYIRYIVDVDSLFTYEDMECILKTEPMTNTQEKVPDDAVIYKEDVNIGYVVTNSEIYTENNEWGIITVKMWLPEELTVKDNIYFYDVVYDFLGQYRNIFPICSLIFGILTILLGVVIILFSGHCDNKEGTVLGPIDRIPLELVGIIMGTLIYAYGYIFSQITYMRHIPELISDVGIVYLLVLIGIVVYAIVLIGLRSFIIRCKVGYWYRNTIIYRVIIRFLRKLWVIVKKFVKMMEERISIFLLGAGIFVGISLVELIIIIGLSGSVGIIIPWLIEKIIIIPILMWILWCMKILEEGGEKLAEGDISYRVDVKNMRGIFKRHGENLNSISEGIKIAVEEQMKSERMKTEMITNVSHDIRTPLTSIVNYVDLLKKENLSPEIANTYVETLERQTERLKRLTEDVIEASKAASGAISVNLEPTDLKVLLTQVYGEYENKLESASLTPVMNIQDDLPQIMADGRLLWRVLNNIFGNICKYSLAGTRVYIEVYQKSQSQVEINIKNISRNELNVSGDELMERFVRGDQSRNTEGSGLGLSIAKSLMDCIEGSMNIKIDGDLFKVELLLRV